MMNYSINQLSTKNTSKKLAEIISSLPPIVLSTIQLSVMLTLIMISLPSFAEQTDKEGVTSTIKEKQSYSLGQITSDSNKVLPEQILKSIGQRIEVRDSDQHKSKALTLSREEVINQKQQQAAKKIPASIFTKMANISNSRRSYNNDSFIIYDAYSQLIEDYDYDGYYQTFSVTFDADLITYSHYDEALVYAELYLSENGGPWQHYYTTDNFIIHGESSDDEFEVYSTLQQGFTSNHYDVLIDLYEVGYTNIIASYSSDDTNSLYALPLESSDYDIENTEYYEEAHIHGGSESLITLLVLSFILIRRLSL
ncbi:MAG: hypothetical protein GY787_05950 [Alteromonadales bacterium]|nr:hypothetical protein [Alteromonadales bacterium]